MVLHWPVFEIISEQTLARITESEPQNLANIAWAFATIKWCNEPLVSAMAEQCVRSVKQFGPQECANFAWALANIMLVDMPCLAALGNKFMTGLRSGSTQNLTNTVWAYAQMKVRRTTLFYSVAQEAVRRLPEFRERDLSITAWSYGRMELREETLILAISREAMSRDFRGKHQEIANLCWAMAQLDLRDTKLLEGMATAALSSELGEFSSQELANTLWSFASLKVHNEALTDTFAAHVLTEVLPEAISQNIVNIAWALNCLGWKDNQGGFHRILSHFLKVCSRSLGVEWVTLASIAQERGLQSLNGFWAQFESFVLAPALAHLEALRVAMNELTFNERFQAMQQWVEEIQLPHLGPTFLTDALRAAGANRAPSTAEWILEARAAVANSAWWSCPKAAVSSQGVVAFMSAELQVGAGRVTDPGTVYQADDAPGLVLVERLLQPIYLQVPRHGHAERRALVALLRAVLQSAAGAANSSTILQDTTGFVRLYASHYLCISCLASLAQLKRHMPKILLEVGCDDAWSSWRRREPEANHVLRVGLQSES